MKNLRKYILIAAVILFCAGCGNEQSGNSRIGSGSSTVSNVINAQIAAAEKDSGKNATPTTAIVTEAPDVTDAEPTMGADTTPEAAATETPLLTPTEAPAQVKGPAPEYPDVDVDLTVLSPTMVYSEVYSMMYFPENYEGKIIKMAGQFSLYHDDYTGIDYYYCIIKDATACCAQGMEFVLYDGCVYPNDYPDTDEEFTVIGEYTTYTEGDALYCTLKNAVLFEDSQG